MLSYDLVLLFSHTMLGFNILMYMCHVFNYDVVSLVWWYFIFILPAYCWPFYFMGRVDLFIVLTTHTMLGYPHYAGFGQGYRGDA